MNSYPDGVSGLIGFWIYARRRAAVMDHHRVAVGKRSNCPRPPLYLPHALFQRIVGEKRAPMPAGEHTIVERLVNARFPPIAWRLPISFCAVLLLACVSFIRADSRSSLFAFGRTPALGIDLHRDFFACARPASTDSRGGPATPREYPQHIAFTPGDVAGAVVLAPRQQL
jgi:hypothetical protein